MTVLRAGSASCAYRYRNRSAWVPGRLGEEQKTGSDQVECSSIVSTVRNPVDRRAAPDS